MSKMWRKSYNKTCSIGKWISMSLFFLFVIFLVSSGCTRTIIKKKYVVPEIRCPKLISIEFEEYSVDNTEEENYLVTLNNIEKANRMLTNRENVLYCYMKNFEEWKKKGSELNKKEGVENAD